MPDGYTYEERRASWRCRELEVRSQQLKHNAVRLKAKALARLAWKTLKGEGLAATLVSVVQLTRRRGAKLAAKPWGS